MPKSQIILSFYLYASSDYEYYDVIKWSILSPEIKVV